MKNLIYKSLFITIAAMLSACTNNMVSHNSGTETHKQMMDREVTETMGDAEMLSGIPVGGNLANAMDTADKKKLAHALDKPVGKSTQWKNEQTGIAYTAIPTRKLTLNNNPFCRAYSVTATRSESTRQINGTACVGRDGGWLWLN